MRKRFLVLLAALALGLHCNYRWNQEPEQLKTDEIVGVWQGSYFGGQETFTFKGDGTLVQEFTRDGKVLYKKSAHWTRFLKRPNDGYSSDGVEVSGGVYWWCDGNYPEASARYEANQSFTIYYHNMGLFDSEKILLICDDDNNNGYLLRKRRPRS
jgi:hypothetical protein